MGVAGITILRAMVSLFQKAKPRIGKFYHLNRKIKEALCKYYNLSVKVKIMKIDPKEIKGNWAHGWALDIHTLSSMPIGYNEFGHLEFDTTRSEIGEAIYKLKYRDDGSQVEAIAQVVSDFIKSKQELKEICAIIATPPSDVNRPFQPVIEISKVIGV